MKVVRGEKERVFWREIGFCPHSRKKLERQRRVHPRGERGEIAEMDASHWASLSPPVRVHV
jgi:hypothetical protein